MAKDKIQVFWEKKTLIRFWGILKDKECNCMTLQNRLCHLINQNRDSQIRNSKDTTPNSVLDQRVSYGVK